MSSSWTVIGTSRLGNDPELSYTPKGTAVCKFSLPVDIGWGENKETEWVKVTVFGSKAEICNKYLRKGSLVSVNCKLEKTWVSEQGKATIQLVVNDIDFIADFGKQDQFDTFTEQDEIPF